MEINSKPEELDSLDRKIRQIEIELVAIKRGKRRGKNQATPKGAERAQRRTQHPLRPVEPRERKWWMPCSRPRRISNELKSASRPSGARRRLWNGSRNPLRKTPGSRNQKCTAFKKNSPSPNLGEGPDQGRGYLRRYCRGSWQSGRGSPSVRMLQSDKDKLLHLEKELHKRLVGQEKASSLL